MFPLNKAFRFRFWPPLPSFRRHTHTHTYTLEVGPTPFGLPLIGLPYFVCIAGGFVAVSLVASIYLLHC